MALLIMIIASAAVGFFIAAIFFQAKIWQMADDHTAEIARLNRLYGAQVESLADKTDSAATKADEAVKKLDKIVPNP